MIESSYTICIWHELEDMPYVICLELMSVRSMSSALHHHQLHSIGATAVQGFELLDSYYVKGVIVLDALRASKHPEGLKREERGFSGAATATRGIWLVASSAGTSGMCSLLFRAAPYLAY